jgi:hypothetical protein
MTWEYNAFGCTNFKIHGDRIDTFGRLSKGCIIINTAEIRRSIYNSIDTVLVVR